MAKKELPQVLILKRKFIQRFPNNYEVGLYYSDELKQYIAIPVQDSNIVVTKESVLDTLNSISQNDDVSTIMFEDASELNINKECSDIVLNYINEHFDEDITSSDKAFLDILAKATQIEEETQEREIQ